MKICIFAYNFEHKKTYEGLCKLKMHNIKISKIFAANKVFLNIKDSIIKVGIDDLKYDHPKKIANNINIPYIVTCPYTFRRSALLAISLPAE